MFNKLDSMELRYSNFSGGSNSNSNDRTARRVRIASNAALLWAVRVITLSCSAVLSILTARFLGPHGRGLYMLPAIDASLGTTFAAGLSSAAAYYLLNRGAGRSIIPAATLVLLVFVGGGFALTYATAAASHSAWAFLAAAAFTAAYAAYSVAYGCFLGFDRARSAGVLNAAAYLLTISLVTIALLVGHSSPKLAIVGWVLGMAIAGVIGLALVFRIAWRLRGTVVAFPEFLQFASRTGLVNLANLLNYRVDLFVVAIFAPVAVTGLYTLAVTGAESVLSLTIALSQASQPRVGKLGHAEAGAFTARCLRNSVFFAFILALVGLIAAPGVVRLIFGQTYSSIIPSLRVLFIGLVAASTSSVISNYFVLNRGRTQVPLVTSLISTVICAGISVALVPKVGMLGAAIGSTVAYVSSQVIALWLFCKESKTAWKSTVFIDRRDVASYVTLVRRLSTLKLR